VKSLVRVVAAMILAVVLAGSADAGPLQAGVTAFKREDYVKAERLLRPLAERGNAHAQTYLGFMYEYGRGVPQNPIEAMRWYCLAAEQDHPQAQYFAARDFVEAHKWMNLAASHAPRKDREDWVRMRDAIASKMSTERIALAQQRAEEWRAKRLARNSIVVGRSRAPELVIELK
jgi:TPR repeat protein